ncbi:PPE domain-containing protein [Umezawaea sp. Da 62-37]|uniref:PPE domain-containing protein n=1 Tax=Umezawaea sp. Da 62-37 TaxID=3075927 RepID=UPI0028F73A7F|nr:PPE domain-containing protein [Umezawaea sp. Da 62-37]WNV85867.1 PPE domain-containing protein [Umezawaea sp. Da 62-37]
MNERRGGYHSELNQLSKAERKKNARRVRQRQANQEPGNFGKINWRAYEHRRLWEMVKSADTGQMATRTYQWQQLAADVDQATADVHKVVQNLVLSWRGPSAVAGAGAASRLTEWAADSSQRAYQVGSGLDTYTAAVDEAARAMPEPVHPTAEKWFRDGYDVTTLDGPEGAYMLKQLLDDHKPSKQEQQEAMDRAVRVMDQYEAASYEVGARLPVFEEAPTGTTVTPDHQPPAVPVPPPYPPATPAPTPLPTPAPPDGGPTASPPDGRPDGTTGVASVGAPTHGTPGYGTPGYGTPGYGVPGAYGSQPGFGGSTYNPGGAYATGTGANAGFGGASGVIGAGPAAAAAARGGFAPGAGGGQGYGMYPPMAPGGREEDGEHRNRYDLGLDLLDDLPPAFPPVLGE